MEKPTYVWEMRSRKHYELKEIQNHISAHILDIHILDLLYSWLDDL